MHVRSGLSRRLDPSLPSNLLVLVVTPMAGVATGSWRLLAGEPFGDAVWGGILGGGAAFLAWAVARELDPDRPQTATLASLLAPWGLLAGDPALLGVTVMMLGARVASGTTGERLHPTDAAALALFALGSGGGGAGPVPGALVGAVLPVVDRPMGWAAGPLVAAASFGGWVLWGVEPAWSGLAGGEWILVAAVLPAVAGVVWVRVTVPTDGGDATVQRARVRGARLLVLAGVAGAAAWSGASGLESVSPALVGAAAAGFPVGSTPSAPDAGGAT